MSITVFFPRGMSWNEADEWVAARRLPVKMHKPAAAVFAGRTLSRYCDEIEYDTRRHALVYHRANVQLRRAR